MREKLVAAILIAALFAPHLATAEALSFAPGLRVAGWTAVSFPGIAPAQFKTDKTARLGSRLNSAAGLLWREVSRPMQIARTAHWRTWRVDEGVVPTDLTKRGFDDRALGVYFVFSDRPDVPKSPMAIFDNASVTALA